MNWFRNHYTQLRSALIGAVMIGILLLVWYGYGLYQERRATEAEIAARNESVEAESAVQETETAAERTQITPSQSLYLTGQEQKAAWQVQEDGTVEYGGKHYRRNSYTKAILCMGIDRKDEMSGTREFGEAGQADALFVIAQDTARNEIRILMIPRDSMIEMEFRNLADGTPEGRKISHVNLAFAFADGETESCEAMVNTVSDLLCGLSIDRYLTADISILSTLNDAVDGVTVTIPNEGMEQKDPAFVKGAQVTLHGAQSEAFVRFRDINKDNSALYRMDQHEEYIQQFFQAVKRKSREDSQIVVHLFDLAEKYMLTDMDKAEYLKIGVDAMNGSSLIHENFVTLPGMGITTDEYDEYYVNYDQAIPVILDLFYHETD